MKKINAIIYYGHIYDAQTKQRIEFKDNSKIELLFSEENKVENEIISKEEYAEYEKHRNKIKEKSAFKILEKGEHIYFNIAEEINKYFFQITLLEALYANKSSEKKFSLLPCMCVVTNELKNQLPLFEEIHATSLGFVYKKTVIHYFGSAKYGVGQRKLTYFTHPSCEMIYSIEKLIDPNFSL